jgi:uncharacterized membrane protein YgcG
VAGDNKAVPLLAALRAGTMTDLVVDERTAARLLELARAGSGVRGRGGAGGPVGGGAGAASGGSAGGPGARATSR